MFHDTIIKALVEAANGAGIEPAAMLAIAEVETSGATFEQDGKTPQLLYERHVAWREAAKKSKRLQSAFASAGLAIPKWSRKTQYKDQGNSASRLALIGRARGIDAEIANRSASWGIGQTMGFLAEELGFPNACAMVDHMTGSLAGQIDCMVGELKNKHLIEPLNAHDWAKVARVYNGPGYAENRYDTRLADAHKRWSRQLITINAGKAVKIPDLSSDDKKAVQRKLREAGFPGVGKPDGNWGRNTIGAVSAFQAHEGLPVTGEYDDATASALDIAVPAEPARERKAATASDLAAAGSKTIKAANAGGLIAKSKMLFGGALVAGGGAEQAAGLLDVAQTGVDKANQAKGILQSLNELAAPVLGNPVVMIAGGILIASGIAVYFIVEAIKARRVADHNSGVHAGPIED